MEDLLQKIDAERAIRFKRPWSKLDKGSKLSRLSLFVKLEKAEKGLSDEEEKRLKILLTQLCEAGALNKASEVTYSEDEERIEGIKNLVYDEETSIYSFTKVEKKTKTTQKSKSNVDRHFSRSKETTR